MIRLRMPIGRELEERKGSLVLLEAATARLEDAVTEVVWDIK